jgi:inosine/xanthosine triphosphatase
MLIAIGSTNPVKIAAVEEAARYYWVDASCRAIEVDTGVSAMPMSDEETVLGARNRAEHARDCLGADIGIGLEGGAMETPWGLFLTNWVVAIGAGGKIGYGSSTRMRLPNEVAEALRCGAELGPTMDRITGRVKSNHSNGAIGHFTHDLVLRKDAFLHAVAYALVIFVNDGYST